MLFFIIKDPEIQGLLMFKGFTLKDQREFLCAKIYKISIIIKNVNGSEYTLMHKAGQLSNYFFQPFHT